MDVNSKAYKCIYGQNLMAAKSSVRFSSSFRLDRAREQISLPPAKIESIIDHTNTFLGLLGFSRVDKPGDIIANPAEVRKSNYDKIKDDYGLKHIDDIIWMAFTKEKKYDNGYLGVVAVGADINFDMPLSKDDNHKTIIEKGHYKYNTSGIILRELGKSWDKSFVLVFPLPNLPLDGVLKRGDIECGIGNYLIDNNVPIIDYYSHRF